MIPLYIIQFVLTKHSLLQGNSQDELAYFLQTQLQDPRFSTDALTRLLEQHFNIVLTEYDARIIYHELRQL